MIAYTIVAAIKSDVFADIIVSTDSELYADIARHYGAEVPFLRPETFATSTSPDIEWVEYTLKRLHDEDRRFACFSILRPTSPFRQPETIIRAFKAFIFEEGVDSMRAVEACSQHPGKMWRITGNRMTPVLPFSLNETPWHSCQYQALPEVYVQNASLEIAYTRVVMKRRTISGNCGDAFFYG